jgi:hypothetical protein
VKARRLCGIVLLAGLAILAACAPDSGSDTPPTASAQAWRAINMATQAASRLQRTRRAETVGATATAQTLEAQLAAARRWTLVISEDFADNDPYSWPLGPDTDDLADIEWTLDGKYRWVSQAKEGFVWWAIPEMSAYPNLYAAVEAEQISGPENAEFGLAYRLDDDQYRYYVFEINTQGQFAVYLWDGESWSALVDWTDHPAIRTAGANRLEVLAIGPQHTFAVNGVVVGGLTDDRFPSGKAGCLIGMSAEGDSGEWVFDNFEFRSNDAPLPTPTPAEPLLPEDTPQF